MKHYDGDPAHCSEDCAGPHFEDEAPEVCPDCGGNGRACYPRCTDAWEHPRPYEEGEGQ